MGHAQKTFAREKKIEQNSTRDYSSRFYYSVSGVTESLANYHLFLLLLPVKNAADRVLKIFQIEVLLLFLLLRFSSSNIFLFLAASAALLFLSRLATKAAAFATIRLSLARFAFRQLKPSSREARLTRTKRPKRTEVCSSMARKSVLRKPLKPVSGLNFFEEVLVVVLVTFTRTGENRLLMRKLPLPMMTPAEARPKTSRPFSRSCRRAGKIFFWAVRFASSNKLTKMTRWAKWVKEVSRLRRTRTTTSSFLEGTSSCSWLCSFGSLAA